VAPGPGLKLFDSTITPMPDPDDAFEARLVVLEREVARLRDQAILISSDATGARVDAAAARVLAAGADRDVSEVRAELRAHIQALNALRETQLEQTREMREGFTEIRKDLTEMRGDLTETRKDLTEMRGDLTETRKDLTEMRGDLAEMREGFAQQATGMAQITALLTKIAESEGHH
jgi:chromosome segregation ATPase